MRKSHTTTDTVRNGHKHVRPSAHRFLLLGLIFLVLVPVPACSPVGPGDGKVGDDPPPPPKERSLFDSYVALGSGLTAGYRSRGVSPESQAEPYPVLLARAMGTAFNVPLLADPGCPAPILDAWTLERPPGGEGCSGRASPAADTIHNVAVPGTFLADLEKTGAELAASNPLHALLLGNRTQLEAALSANPTFVTIEFGMDDAIAAYRLDKPVCCQAIASSFQTQIPALVEALVDHGVKGGVVLGPGLPYYAYFSGGGNIRTRFEEGQLPATFQVVHCDDDAQDSDYSLVPFDYLRDLFQRSLGGESVVLDCRADPPLVTFGENSIPGNNMWQMDEMGRFLFDQYGWSWVSRWQTWSSGIQQGLPNLPGSPDPTFGPNFSLDGVYPSAEGHRIIANMLIGVINATYETDLVVQ